MSNPNHELTDPIAHYAEQFAATITAHEERAIHIMGGDGLTRIRPGLIALIDEVRPGLRDRGLTENFVEDAIQAENVEALVITSRDIPIAATWRVPELERHVSAADRTRLLGLPAVEGIPLDNFGYTENLGVHPDFRQQGIGRGMAALALRNLRDRSDGTPTGTVYRIASDNGNALSVGKTFNARRLWIDESKATFLVRT